MKIRTFRIYRMTKGKDLRIQIFLEGLGLVLGLEILINQLEITNKKTRVR